MRLTGRANAAAALAVYESGGGSPPQPTAPGPSAPAPPAASGVEVPQPLGPAGLFLAVGQRVTGIDVAMPPADVLAAARRTAVR